MLAPQEKGHGKPVEGYATFEKEKGLRDEDNPWDRVNIPRFFEP
jgi:hypothetical protein